MTATIRDAAGTTLDAVSDLVGDARKRVEHLPRARRRRSSGRRRFTVLALLLAVAAAVAAAGARARPCRRTTAVDEGRATADDTPPLASAFGDDSHVGPAPVEL